MIGWYCDIYTIPKNLVDDLPTILDEYTLIEINRPFTIPGVNDPSQSNAGRFTYEEQLQYLLNKMGNDIYRVYCLPTLTSVDSALYDLIKNYMPSVFLGYPSAFNSPIDYDVLYLIHLKSLSKAIISIDNSNCKIANVNGKILSFNSGTYTDLFTRHIKRNASYQVAIDIPCVIKYETGMDLTNNNNFGVARASFDTRGNYGVKYFQTAFSNPGAITMLLKALFSNAKPDIIPGPFEPIPPSGENTPGGQFDDQSDIIGDSSLPTLSASDTGFTRIYIPTLSQVKDLARYLWTDETVIETIWNKIKQFFENPMEAIIGFNLVPVPVPSSGTKSFALMYIDTGVDMDTAANQFVDVDCGTLPIQLYYGSALDYSPYTKVSCYLPYIGMVQLNTDEVVGRTLQVKYRIDIVSGSCVAKIFVDGNCIYQYSGHCAITIPIAASDFSSYVSAAISVAKLAVGAATGGAAGAAAAALNADVGQQTGSMFSVQSARSDGGQIQLFTQGGASGPGTQTEQEIKNTQASFSGITPQNVANTVGEIMTAKPHVQHSGSFSGNSGYLGVRRPFVIIERPNLCLPENYQGFNGFPAMITMLLGECSGYTKVQQMVLSGCTATNPEQAEIMSLLKGGVIF